MTGAVMMTAYAALRSGAGLVTAALPESLVPVFEAAVQEVMSLPLAETSDCHHIFGGSARSGKSAGNRIGLRNRSGNVPLSGG